MSELVLDQILKEVREIRSVMVTKDELDQRLRSFATKEDLKALREDLKEELKSFAKKEDMAALREELKSFATKEDLASVKDDLASVKDDIASVKDDLSQRMETGFRDLKQMIESYHVENINADEILLRKLNETDRKVEQYVRRTELSTDILNRRQLKLETEIEILKER